MFVEIGKGLGLDSTRIYDLGFGHIFEDKSMEAERAWENDAAAGESRGERRARGKEEEGARERRRGRSATARERSGGGGTTDRGGSRGKTMLRRNRAGKGGRAGKRRKERGSGAEGEARDRAGAERWRRHNGSGRIGIEGLSKRLESPQWRFSGFYRHRCLRRHGSVRKKSFLCFIPSLFIKSHATSSKS
jgi:hypothetical protein